ncbi:baeRF2 domain-containing protein [Streptomyces cyaneofuscatus]|uniref:baeRF2 domain-containing protein n=1 Tax=Streptomyces cyaneofuscatus TaxID=66883 RepID=UPI0004CA1994|nr:Vms1/Ankzf1 family peptidyl-tRNA hydrolase [Streptomyces cyaneofuscatus]
MDLAPLTPLYERPGPWASAYLDTSFADEATLSRRELKGRQISEELAAQGADQETCRAVRRAIDSYAYGQTPGRAVFAAHGQVVFEPVLGIPPPDESSAVWAPLPHVAPLLELTPDEPDTLVVHIDRVGADFELRTAAGNRPEGTVEGRDWPVHRTATSDWSERHFQLSVENTWEENARTVASAVEEAVTRTGAALVVLVGDERERRTVHEALPAQFRVAVVETGHGGRAAGSDSTRLDEWIAAERRRQAYARADETLERFAAAKGRDGSTGAADGVEALVDAAREHRIATLLLRPDGPDTHREVWAGPKAEQIALRRTDARALGEPEPFPVRADDALLRSATLTGADVVVVGVDAARDRSPAEDLAADNRPETGRSGSEPVGGLGAVLRWPTDGNHPLVETGT